MSWTCKREAMYMLVYKHVENDHTGVGQQITRLISFRRRNYLQFFTFWIFFNPSNYANSYNYLLFHFRMFTISKLRLKMK